MVADSFRGFSRQSCLWIFVYFFVFCLHLLLFRLVDCQGFLHQPSTLSPQLSLLVNSQPLSVPHFSSVGFFTQGSALDSVSRRVLLPWFFVDFLSSCAFPLF